MPKDTIFEEYS